MEFQNCMEYVFFVKTFQKLSTSQCFKLHDDNVNNCRALKDFSKSLINFVLLMILIRTFNEFLMCLEFQALT